MSGSCTFSLRLLGLFSNFLCFLSRNFCLSKVAGELLCGRWRVFLPVLQVQASQEVIGFSHSVCHLSIKSHSPDYTAHTPGFQEQAPQGVNCVSSASFKIMESCMFRRWLLSTHTRPLATCPFPKCLVSSCWKGSLNSLNNTFG